MSTILLTHHNENIYNIIKKEEAKPPPKISAKSPYIANLLEAEEKKNKFCHKTFGFAEVPLNKPSEYLKKHSRILPPCPKIVLTENEEEKCKHRDFCHKNVIQAVRLAPRQPQRNYVDTKKGDTYPLQPSGLEPHYILKKGLKNNWAELQKAYQQLPILTDTIPKKKHKTKLEVELKQLENDIKTLERHPHIYVTDADCSVFSYDPEDSD
ncbi:hypothetical protein C0J52_06916 [Blattella germanica]|nr:hypothetical protein C0J52_06916 [Blattella germanica]